MELLKGFVITLVTTIIFMTAVELIAPDNSMKKYIKFILGLLLISVILTPIVAMLTKGESVLTKEILKENGYHQYEISNFSKKDKECYHNKVYWQLKEYLGLGVSASSYIDGKRIKNIDDIANYIENIDNNKSVTEEVYKNNINDEMEEFMFMGLRMLEGIEEKEFKNKFKKDIDIVYGEIINKNIKKGLLIRKDGRICLTSYGIEVSNSVMSDFII